MAEPYTCVNIVGVWNDDGTGGVVVRRVNNDNVVLHELALSWPEANKLNEDLGRVLSDARTRAPWQRELPNDYYERL